ncbi:MAG: VOC family protein [Acidobacteria bacterium]|nr:MAG: VOC family protein [Acidobacteriota bacterium]
MANLESHEPGTFCWIELGTSDPIAAKQYYTSLFDWTTNENDMGPDMGIYYIFQKNGRDCAAMYKQGADQQGVPPNWMSYVNVVNADESTERAKSLGANVMAGPFDVNDFGRMAVMMDPQGAPVSVWQAMKHIGVQVRDEANTLCWNELQARDVPAAKTFYSTLFGWTLKESPEYTEFNVGQRPIGGMMQSQAPEGVPSYWLPYFAVDDCDAMFEKSNSLGGSSIMPPSTYPGVGRFSILTDPQGAVFAIIKLELTQHS